MMLNKCLLIALLAVSLTAATSIRYTGKTADMDMLVKQKKIFDLLMYNTELFTDAEYFEVGRNYDIMGNIDHYNNRELVMEFMMRFKLGMLHKDALFTYYKQEHREEMMLLYRLFYFAKDFATFYKTACWARIYMNHGMFTTAFTTAVIYRDDTKYIRLPAIYEIYPNLFFDAKIVRDAQRITMTRGMTGFGHDLAMRKTNVMDTVETYHLYSNYTGMCMSPMFNEKRLAYFTDDVNLNAYYYYFRMMLPFWMDTKNYELGMYKNLRGEFYYFFHQQLMARYYLERFSNGMGEIEEFTWDRMHLPGFHSNIMYTNGVAMPRRDWWNMVPMYKLKYLEYLKKLEIRIMEAIDSGYIVDEMGKQVSIMTPEGLNILGNIVEGNYDSYNLKYYGAYDVLARDILGINYNSVNKNYYVPNSLQFFSTSMKDPAFYRIYNKIVNFYYRYKSLMNRYTKNELEFNGVRFENVEVDKLVTYFDTKDYLINNAVDVGSLKKGGSFNIKAWQYHLNYKPFTYKMNINSDKTTKAVVSIFLGPAFDNEKYDDYSYLLNYYRYFFKLDEFDVNLREGMNNIDRRSTDSIFFKKEHLTGDKFYKKIMQAIEGKEAFTFDESMYGFPEYLMLPKGTVEGMKFKLFFYIGPYEEGKMMEMPFFGKYIYHGKSLGFPLDRPMYPWFMSLGNCYFKDVYIYNLMDEEMMKGSSMNMMMDYGSMMRMHEHGYMSMKDVKGDTMMKEDAMKQDMNYMNMRDSDRMMKMHDINMMHVF